MDFDFLNPSQTKTFTCRKLNRYFRNLPANLPFVWVPTIQKFYPKNDLLKITLNFFQLTQQEKLTFWDIDFVDSRENFSNLIKRKYRSFPKELDLLNDNISVDQVNSYFWVNPNPSQQTSQNLLEKFQAFYSNYSKNRIVLLEKSSRDLNYFTSSKDFSKKSVNLRTFSVGQANFSGLFYGKSRTPDCVFDIGCKNPTPINIRRFRKIDSNGYVVLSHFDSDHINGSLYLLDRAFLRKWIMPELPNIPFSATLIGLLDRMVSATGGRPNLFIIPNNSFSSSPFSICINQRPSCSVDIYTGKVKPNGDPLDKNQSTSENAHSLICDVYVDKNKRALLPGDALYKEFPKTFRPKYFLVPHHGCKYVGSLSHIAFKHIKKMFVLCRCPGHFGYHHPNLSHYQRLKTKTKKRWLRFITRNNQPIIFDGNHSIIDHFSGQVSRSSYSFKLK